MTDQIADRLAEIETMYGPLRPAIRSRLQELLATAGPRAIDAPAAIYGQVDGELHVEWKMPSGRIIAYVLDDEFLIEFIPVKPQGLFSVSSAEAAGAYMSGLLRKF